MFIYMKVFVYTLVVVFAFSCAQKVVNDDLNKSKAAAKHIDAAKAYIDEGNTRKGLYHLQKSEEFQDKSLDLFHTYAMLYRFEGDAEREKYYYKKALREDRSNSQVKNNYGSFLCFHNEADKGIKLLEDATNDYAYMGRAEAYVNRGLCELVLEKPELAEKSFQQALRLNTQSSRPLIELADIYFKRGDLRLADMYFQQFANQSSMQNARSLWLGIQIAHNKGDENTVASYGLALEKRFPSSSEYQAYLEFKQ